MELNYDEVFYLLVLLKFDKKKNIEYLESADDLFKDHCKKDIERDSALISKLEKIQEEFIKRGN